MQMSYAVKRQQCVRSMMSKDGASLSNPMPFIMIVLLLPRVTAPLFSMSQGRYCCLPPRQLTGRLTSSAHLPINKKFTLEVAPDEQ